MRHLTDIGHKLMKIASQKGLTYENLFETKFLVEDGVRLTANDIKVTMLLKIYRA
jgi:hypothetical protein